LRIKPELNNLYKVYFLKNRMPILELETPEAIYRNDMVRGCHFMIDCACKGRDREYSGSHYKNSETGLEEMTGKYLPLRANKHEHTFYLNEFLFVFCLDEQRGKPLVIVCNDCCREFSFTQESYSDLKNRMIGEYNRKLEEQFTERTEDD